MVSALGFGVMRLPARKKGDWNSVNFAAATRVLRAAFESGVNFVDSHHGYHGGLSEVAIGRALKGWKGQRIIIQTKAPFYDDKPQYHFKKLLVEALEKTGVNTIDYLFFHSLRMKDFKKRGKKFFRFTDWAIKKGYIRRRGFSSHDTPENIRTFIDTGEFSNMLVSFNWHVRTVEDTIAYAADRGMGVAVMNPIGGGSLAARAPQILRLLPGAKTSAEVGLRYVLSTPGVTLALSGMNALDQVTENTTTASQKTPMTTRQRRAMQARLKRLDKKARLICTGCGYCMPCPHGVDIPQNFLRFNQARLFGLVEASRAAFKHLRQNRDGDKSAFACKKCGQCLPKCPNNVPIIKQLAETAKLLG